MTQNWLIRKLPASREYQYELANDIKKDQEKIKQHINEAIGTSETTIKQHINEFFGLFENRIQEHIKNLASQNEFNLKNEIKKSDESQMFLLGQYILNTRDNNKISCLKDAEMGIFSQWGEDGIIQWIINKISICNQVFIEFGVENYKESNTRFLLMNNNWSGLVIDASIDAIHEIKRDPIYWRHEITAINQFITKENINGIISQSGLPHDIGLLSIDIDGNDYWIWQAITTITPRIVICEYNSVFGCDYSITIPYTPDFTRTEAHYSNLYWGASLPALCALAQQKGYVFIGSNSAGNNAFFIRNDLASGFRSLSAKEGYVNSKFRESRDCEGQLSFLSGEKRYKILQEMPVVDVSNNTIRSLYQLFNEHSS